MEQVDASNKHWMHRWQWGNSFWEFALNNTESSGETVGGKINDQKSMQQTELMIRRIPAVLNAKAAVTEGRWSMFETQYYRSVLQVCSVTVTEFSQGFSSIAY